MQVTKRLRRRFSKRGGEEPRPYVCLSCEARFERQYYLCPACGGYSVEHARWQREEPIP